MSKHDEVSIAHMYMIQDVVTRLETNCFMLKAVCMSLVVALLAFMSSTDNASYYYILFGCVPIVIFWIMDAVYLRMGRMFRKLFNKVRLHQMNDPFSMDISPYKDEVPSLFRTAVSWSIVWYYLSILLVFLFVIGIQLL